MGDTAVRCSSGVSQFGLVTSYGMYVMVSSTHTIYYHITSISDQDNGETADSIPLGTCTRVVDNLMQVIRNNSDVTQHKLLFHNFSQVIRY